MGFKATTFGWSCSSLVLFLVCEDGDDEVSVQELPNLHFNFANVFWQAFNGEDDDKVLVIDDLLQLLLQLEPGL